MGHLVIDFEHFFCCWGFPSRQSRHDQASLWPQGDLPVDAVARLPLGEKENHLQKSVLVGDMLVPRRVDWWHEFHVISKLQNYLVQYPSDILKRYTIQTIHIVIEVRSLRAYGGGETHFTRTQLKPNMFSTFPIFTVVSKRFQTCLGPIDPWAAYLAIEFHIQLMFGDAFDGSGMYGLY